MGVEPLEEAEKPLGGEDCPLSGAESTAGREVGSKGAALGVVRGFQWTIQRR